VYIVLDDVVALFKVLMELFLQSVDIADICCCIRAVLGLPLPFFRTVIQFSFVR